MTLLVIGMLSKTLFLTFCCFIWMKFTPFLLTKYQAKFLYYSWFFLMASFIIPFTFDFTPKIIYIDTPMKTVTMHAVERLDTPLPSTTINSTIETIHNISPTDIIFIIWLAGLLIFWIIALTKHYRLIKLFDRWASSIDDVTIQRLEQVKYSLGITAHIELKRCELVQTPMLVGIFRPTILLPVLSYTDRELTVILKHELIHFQRKDLWYKLFTMFVWSVQWFNPLFYYFLRDIEQLGEYACDEAVVENEDIVGKKAYSRAIILSANHTLRKTCFSFHLMSRPYTLKQRITAIMDERRKIKGTLVSFFIALLAMSSILVNSVFAIAPTKFNYIDKTFMKNSILTGASLGDFSTDHYIIQSPNHSSVTLDAVKDSPYSTINLPKGMAGYEARYVYPVKLTHEIGGRTYKTIFCMEYDYALSASIPFEELNMMIEKRLIKFEMMLKAIDTPNFTNAYLQKKLQEYVSYINQTNNDSRVFFTFGFSSLDSDLPLDFPYIMFRSTPLYVLKERR